MRTTILHWFIGTVAAAFAAAATAATPAPAGRVQVASGEVAITTPGQPARTARRGDDVFEGDTIATGRAGAAHLRMADGGIIAMRPDTSIVIDTFRWSGKEDGTEASVLSLLKGGFRTITGLIGRTNRSQYTVKTSAATIGIRGTDHEPFHIPLPQAGETPIGEPGTYNKVNVGETFIQSGTQTLEIATSEIGFASVQPGVAPVKLDRLPEFMRGTLLPRGKADLRNIREFAARDPRRAQLARALEERGISPRGFRRYLWLRTRTAGEDFDLSGQSGGFRFAPAGVVLSGSLVFREGGLARFDAAGAISGNSTDSILLNPNNEPVIVADKSSNFRYSREGAPLIDRGAAIVDGEGVKWGIYAGGVRFDQQGASQALLFTFAMASQATPIAILTQPGGAIYGTTVGFTTPVDENRNVGGMARLDATVIFGANPRLTNYDLRVLDGSARVWRANLNTPAVTLQSFARNPSGANLAVTCAGAACGAPSGVGQASGFVIGQNRGGMISSYGLVAGNSGVTGSIVVSR
jgi:hypothetical protein